MKIYLQPSIFPADALRDALAEEFEGYQLTERPQEADLQVADYEELDFEAALNNCNKWICAYSIRKALIRKHFLSQTIREFTAKRPKSILSTSVPDSWTLEVDYAEFLDDALDEAFELRGELELNESREPASRDWYILKPGMADRGAGLRLFSTIAELQEIFDENDPDTDIDNEDEILGDSAQIKGPLNQISAVSTDTGVMTSDMRFFVVQKYLSRPLMLNSLNHRKFHIRAYVLCIGNLQVYLHRNLLMLVSSEVFAPPSFDTKELDKHLTNTCYQTESSAGNQNQNVYDFWNVPDAELCKDKIWSDLMQITCDLFSAASAQTINFQTLPNAFEIFGIDFLIDESNDVTLLEVNAYPDFAQTGPSLHHLITEVTRDTIRLVAAIIRLGLVLDSLSPESQQIVGNFHCCLQKKLLF